MRNSVS